MKMRTSSKKLLAVLILISALVVGFAAIANISTRASAILPDQVAKPSLPGATRFAVIGDYGDGSTAEGKVAALVDSWNVDFVITTGDNRYGAATFDQTIGQFYCGFLADVEVGTHCAGGNADMNAFFPATGNHDYTDGAGINEYLNYFTLPGNELYYDFVRGPIHFFAIDTQGALISDTIKTNQQNWLQAGLAASTAKWQVVYHHHAPYSSSIKHGSNQAFQWPFAAWGADAVITGHDHTYERIRRDGIVYFVNGLGGHGIYGMGAPVFGSMRRYNSDYGVMLVEANATQMTFQFSDVSGKVIDRSSIPLPSIQTLEVRISQSVDDVEERLIDGVMDRTSSDIELGDDPLNNGEQTGGLRFQEVSIPQGAAIVAAYLEFVTDEVDSLPANVIIQAQASNDAPAFKSAAYNLTNRERTTASASWNIPAWDTVRERHQSPNLSALVQEVVNRSGWYAGSNMVFVISGSGTRTAESYDGAPGWAPLLHVEYESDGDLIYLPVIVGPQAAP